MSVLQMGFFAQAGPLDIFVSNHLIPEDYEFDSTNEPCYRTSGDDSDTILSGSIVRLRIVGTRVDAQEIVRCLYFSFSVCDLACALKIYVRFNFIHCLVLLVVYFQ